jgi:hypothetical protein
VTLLESEQFEQVAPNKPKEAIVMPPSEEGRRVIEGSPSKGCGAGYRHAQASRCRVGRQP